MNTLLKQGNDRGALLQRRKHDVSQPMGLSRWPIIRGKRIFLATSCKRRVHDCDIFRAVPLPTVYFCEQHKSNDGVAGTLDTLCDCL
jgi:hypothetical protein